MRLPRMLHVNSITLFLTKENEGNFSMIVIELSWWVLTCAGGRMEMALRCMCMYVYDQMA